MLMQARQAATTAASISRTGRLGVAGALQLHNHALVLV